MNAVKKTLLPQSNVWLSFLLIFWLAGCSTLKFPAFVHKSASGTVTKQAGPAEVPVDVSSFDSATQIPLVPGSRITIDVPPATSAGNGAQDLAAPKTALPAIVLKTHSEHVQGPRAFTPPKPPTLKEQADANGLANYWKLSAVAAVLGVWLLYRAHGKAALCCFAGAVAFPLVGRLVDAITANYVLLGCLCVAGGLFAAWHFMTDAKKAELEQAAKDQLSKIGGPLSVSPSP